MARVASTTRRVIPRTRAGATRACAETIAPIASKPVVLSPANAETQPNLLLNLFAILLSPSATRRSLLVSLVGVRGAAAGGFRVYAVLPNAAERSSIVSTTRLSLVDARSRFSLALICSERSHYLASSAICEMNCVAREMSRVIRTSGSLTPARFK